MKTSLTVPPLVLLSLLKEIFGSWNSLSQFSFHELPGYMSVKTNEEFSMRSDLNDSQQQNGII